MLNQKKVEILSRKFRKSLAKQFLEVALKAQSVFFATNITLLAHTETTKIQSNCSYINKKTYLCKLVIMCNPLQQSIIQYFSICNIVQHGIK